MTSILGANGKRAFLPFSKLNRPLRVLYTLGADEYQDWIDKRKTPNASSIYRMFLPLALLNASGLVECKVARGFYTKYGEYSLNLDKSLEWADIISFCRINLSEPEENRKFLSFLSREEYVIHYEHDDFYFSLGRGNYHSHLISPWSLVNTKNVIKCADLITSPNYRLNEASLKEAQATQKPISRAIYNAIFIDEWVEAAKERSKHDKVRILLSGASQHYVDWLWVKSALLSLKSRYGERIEFHVQGLHPDTLELTRDRNRFLPAMTTDVKKLLVLFDSLGATYHKGLDFNLYPKAINAISPDIGLIVTSDKIQDTCKSTLKWLDYTMAGAAVVCSKYPPYTDELEDNIHLLYASNITQWSEKVGELIDRPDLRMNLRLSSEHLVMENYDVKKTYLQWVDAFQNAYIKKHGK